MSGECDKCGEHTLECKCIFILQEEVEITFCEPKPIKISIDKEYFRDEFKKVFEKWNYKLGNGMDIYDEEEFLNDLLNTM